MSTAVELRADAQRIRSFALGVTASEVLAELYAMIQERSAALACLRLMRGGGPASRVGLKQP
jgi:hypothetical protein